VKVASHTIALSLRADLAVKVCRALWAPAHPPLTAAAAAAQRAG